QTRQVLPGKHQSRHSPVPDLRQFFASAAGNHKSKQRCASASVVRRGKCDRQRRQACLSKEVKVSASEHDLPTVSNGPSEAFSRRAMLQLAGGAAFFAAAPEASAQTVSPPPPSPPAATTRVRLTI